MADWSNPILIVFGQLFLIFKLNFFNSNSIWVRLKPKFKLRIETLLGITTKQTFDVFIIFIISKFLWKNQIILYHIFFIFKKKIYNFVFVFCCYFKILSNLLFKIWYKYIQFFFLLKNILGVFWIIELGANPSLTSSTQAQRNEVGWAWIEYPCLEVGLKLN